MNHISCLIEDCLVKRNEAQRGCTRTPSRFKCFFRTGPAQFPSIKTNVYVHEAFTLYMQRAKNEYKSSGGWLETTGRSTREDNAEEEENLPHATRNFKESAGCLSFFTASASSSSLSLSVFRTKQAPVL